MTSFLKPAQHFGDVCEPNSRRGHEEATGTNQQLTNDHRRD